MVWENSPEWDILAKRKANTEIQKPGKIQIPAALEGISQISWNTICLKQSDKDILDPAVFRFFNIGRDDQKFHILCVVIFWTNYTLMRCLIFNFRWSLKILNE